jgi:hypothetical protein
MWEIRDYKVIKVSEGISATFALGMTVVDSQTYWRTIECGGTATTMSVIKKRILRFAHLNNDLPQSLAGLPEIRGYDNGVVDDWGHAINYEVSPSGLVTLRSSGRGRDGKGADIVATFPSHDAKGGWSDELVPWSHNPLAQ